MPSLFHRLSQELRDMIFPRTLATAFDQNTFPAFVTAFKNTHYYPELLKMFYQINGMITESNLLAWRAESLKETKKIENLLMVFHGKDLKMTGDKLRRINHFRTLSLDLSHYSFRNFRSSLGVYLIQASTRREKVTIRARTTINIRDFILYMGKSLSGRAVRGEYVVVGAAPEGSQQISYRYIMWEAKRLVWKEPVVVKPKAT